jgi:hypothetical protein
MATLASPVYYDGAGMNTCRLAGFEGIDQDIGLHLA